MEEGTAGLIAALVITLWVGLAYTYLAHSSRHRKHSRQPYRAAPPAPTPGAAPATPLAELVWKTHLAAQDLDAYASTGTSEEVIAAARAALSAAANLSVELRRRELGFSPESIFLQAEKARGTLDKTV